jgi:pimeloyl-ACP methyl ester carboxylesterase
MQSRRVTTEGYELYYEVRGHGSPLLMIPGGGGDGGSYSAVADILSDKFKVITYDRRGNAHSTMNDPQNFEISQQSLFHGIPVWCDSGDAQICLRNSVLFGFFLS